MFEKNLRFLHPLLNMSVYFLLFLNYPVIGTDIKPGSGISHDAIQEPIKLFGYCWPKTIIFVRTALSSMSI